jgi:hypothetical protein
MQCPYYNIAFQPQFKRKASDYNSDPQIFNTVYAQYCPACDQYIVGVHQYVFNDVSYVSESTAEQLLTILKPIVN